MSSIWPSALGSLDDSLALPYESVGKLKAANPINLEEIIQQLQAAAESGSKLRASISASYPTPRGRTGRNYRQSLRRYKSLKRRGESSNCAPVFWRSPRSWSAAALCIAGQRV
jgi:aminopeptidase-like protein